ncbi:hypothetical protein XAUB_03830 [Xanthomonas citri pv. aurantifolii str. ICPB 11122]|nr:hypothetical protein XAUB_03830 [Xanthomonas citri pv. aurantifolii str. ICPB 11122]
MQLIILVTALHLVGGCGTGVEHAQRFSLIDHCAIAKDDPVAAIAAPKKPVQPNRLVCAKPQQQRTAVAPERRRFLRYPPDRDGVTSRQHFAQAAHHIMPIAGVDHVGIVAFPAVQGVVARAAIKLVVPPATVEVIVARVAGELVVASEIADLIVAVEAVIAFAAG